MRKNNYNNWYPGRPDSQQPNADSRPPWMVHPKKRGMPKIVRKLLIVLLILALAGLGICIYMVLNPDIWRTATIS